LWINKCKILEMRIFCIGRNYVAHAKELNNKVPKQPLVFMKPESALNKNGQIPYPSFSQDFHYELEMVLFISKAGKNISLDNAGDHFDHIGLGVDYTARDVQSKCKEKGHSWEIAKAFDNSAYLSEPFDKNNYDLSRKAYLEGELLIENLIISK